MTITYYYFTSDYERCSRLAFGVPLEDSFPVDDIHPSLKELFLRAYENIALCGYPIDQIISKWQGSIEERLSIKESVVLCKPMSGVVSPGALLWVIRHFVGLIPVPLLPRYTDSKTFNWIRLSQFCKRAILRCSQIGGGDKLLVWKIAEELLRLPFPNLLLFSVLINFIRALTTKKQRTPNINKVAALCLIRYFCSSIFVRPYHPDCNKKAERLYLPFLFFVMLKWPEIEKAFKENTLGSPRNNSTQKFNSPFEWHFYRTDFIPRPGSNCFKIACTQTDDYETQLSTISEESLEEEPEFLKDVACQTEFPLFGKKKQQRHHRCCCRYGSNYETSTTLSFEGRNVLPEDKEAQTETCDEFEESSVAGTTLSCSSVHPRSSEVISVSSNTPPYYGWVNPKAKQEIYCGATNQRIASPKTFISDGEYFDDDYNNSNLNLLSTEGKEKLKRDPKILDRLSKIGWTYTPPASLTDGTSGLLTPSKTALKEENYLLFFNDKEGADRDEKDVCSLSSQTCVEGELLGKSASTGSSAKSKRSFSLGKIRSGLDLFKFFAKRKGKLTNTSSLEEVSKIKYKKMNSVRSTIF